MIRVRSAFLMATLGQYLALVVSFVTIAVVSHLMTPAEIGLSVIGASAITMIFSLREFATSDFLIQLDTVENNDVRTAMTVMVILTVFLSLALLIALPALVSFYKSDVLKPFFLLMILAVAIEGLSFPGMALLRRDMLFGKVTVIKTIAAVVNAGVTILFAVLDWSVISFALGAIAGSVTTTGLTLFTRKDWWSFKPSLKSLAAVSEFGRYKGATNVVDRFYDALPQILLGSIMPSAAVGKYSRAVTISGLADRLVLSAVFTVAFPALAAAVREKVDIRQSYLRAISFITVVYWPALLMLVLLITPISEVLLGAGWDEVIPVARLLALSAVFWFPVVLTYPVLIGLGANRSAFTFNIVSRSLSAIIICGAGFFGLMAIAYSQFIALPMQMLLALIYVRRHAYFAWSELFAVLWPSFVVSLATISGPVILIACLGFRLSFSGAEAIYISFLGAVGWFAGILLTAHPFRDEILAAMGDGSRWLRAWSPSSLRSAPSEVGERTTIGG
ncbi:oligosaccharide flippase family protein [Shinella sp.]|uniref:oligosaccharide flippase family protein n=1 Tax=Shinella sp. TaxID=1870904 RepID=UPI003F6EED20